VRFWDTSALIPLVLAETGSAQARRWLAEDHDVIVWTLARVEALSAIARRRREARASARALDAAREALLAGWPHWSEVTAVELVRRHAERIVETHPSGRPTRCNWAPPSSRLRGRRPISPS
jgi:uncharacterized protein with PIN domain